jgi:hypothetical protein
MHDNFILKKNIFIDQYFKNFHNSKNQLKMENKHPENFWSA